MPTNEMSTGAILNVVTERLLTNMDDVYLVFELALGRPVWTHEIPEYFAPVRAALLAEYPELAGPIADAERITKDNCAEFVATWTERLGRTSFQVPCSSNVKA